MTESSLLSLCIWVYLASWMMYLLHAAFRTRTTGRIADLLTLVGLGVHTGSIGMRWVESHRLGIGHAPLSNLYESMVFFAWATVILYLIFARRLKARLLGVFAMPFAFLALASTSLMNKDIQPLAPALQSNWLTAHVLTCFLGYAAFAVASGVSVLYLLMSKGGGGSFAGSLSKMVPNAERLDDFSYRIIAVGFPMLTLGIITGAAWANSAWGSYWSWDPKETWSLIVWLIYAAYLHARIVRGWQGRRAAWLSVVGFAATLFCYLGVNLLLSGLHSYARG